MLPRHKIVELIKRNNRDGYNQYTESPSDALLRELSLCEEFFIMDMSPYEHDIRTFSVSRDITLLTSIATHICEELGYPDELSIQSISRIIDYNHIDNYFVSSADHKRIMDRLFSIS